MLFDMETLAPLYKFSIGQPGSSFTFEVAQINGIPQEIIEEAKLKTDEKKIRMDRLLSELQKEKTHLERLNKEHISAQELAEEARLKYEQKKGLFDQKLRSQQDNIEKNNKYLNAGKKMLGFLAQYKSNSRKKNVNQELMNEIGKYLAVEKSKEVETQKKKVAQAKKAKPKKIAPEKDNHERHKIVVGSMVKLIATRQTGTVETVDGDNIAVLFGFMRMKVERSKLSFVK